MKKTNAMRLLDNSNITYEIKYYNFDNGNTSGVHAAKEINMKEDSVFKTLVTMGDKTGINIFCVPVSGELDFKKAALVSNNKKIEMIPSKDILSTTGYIKGGCSPIGMKKKYPTFINNNATNLDKIAISGGVIGTEIIIDPKILIKFINASFEDIIKH